MSDTKLKPIHLFGNGGPNPPKVAVVLEELGVPYTIDPMKLSQVKEPAFVAINPNGRAPAIQDPNTGLTLWESGAILEYLIDTYDTSHKISFPKGSHESFLTKQWLFFQVTGQGPYYGQMFWFKRYHPEPVPSAVARYVAEVNRVTSVLESWLAKQKDEFAEKGGDGPWLVGNKLTYADLSFVWWQRTLKVGCADDEFDWKKYPLVKEWFDKMSEMETVKKVVDQYPSS